MVKRYILVLTGIFLLCGQALATDGKILRFIYCSDLHYGLEREFRGSLTSADSVSRAMIAGFHLLESTALPHDGGIGAGEIFGSPDFIVCTGDIANRMEDGVQTATESWAQFLRDWNEYPDRGIQIYLVPGNHDISNAIGYPEPLSPETDDASAAGIYRFNEDKSLPGPEGWKFDYSKDKTHYSFVVDSIRFVFMGMWPDSAMRGWYDLEISGADTGVPRQTENREDAAAGNRIPSLIFTHDAPQADAKHFTNPRGRHDINPYDRFQNLLTDTCSVRDISRQPTGNWIVLEDFIRTHPDIKAYFHGDCNYNEFYTWHGPSGSISLPVFRVDSPMKGETSSDDETRLSFIVVCIDTSEKILTARECLWNPDGHQGIRWGESRTISIGD